MFGFEQEIVIFDTEYTTWPGALERNWSGPGEFREVVQIGACIVETEGFQERDSISLFIRPVKNPALSEYFCALTGISQAKVDGEGVSLLEAFHRFGEWMQGRRAYCWGRDIDVMEENCRLAKVVFPFDRSQFEDIRPILEKNGIRTSGYTSGTIPNAVGETPLSRAHDGLNDARSISQALRAMARRA
jgi:inhibitor of KinA sporulation pathway (predicted exonuclease)